MKKTYCKNINHRIRWKTRVVMIGDIGIGGENPIRIQSMTTTNTLDTKSTVKQSIRMIESGCEIVRITAPSIKEAKNLKKIRKEIRTSGYNTPIVADIHFTPNAALVAASLIEKVRINPGNYADKKRFEIYNYTENSYNEELDRIRNRFIPLVKVCKDNGTAMRIGTNHGSLSDRILSRYGDTPIGMVESALEFVRIAESEQYYDIVLSMKASNTQVMVQAYRLLVNRMIKENMNYPLHLGVTEAGEGEDGRIKSSVGIGTLLHDGLGDTIRVSLTEEPEAEIPVAKSLVQRYDFEKEISINKTIDEVLPYNPFFYTRRQSNSILNIGFDNVPRVIGDLSNKSIIRYEDLAQFGYLYAAEQDKWHISDQGIDFLYIGSKSLHFEVPGSLGIIKDQSGFKEKIGYYPLCRLGKSTLNNLNTISFIIFDNIEEVIKNKNNLKNSILIFDNHNFFSFHEQRRWFIELIKHKIKNPVIIKKKYRTISKENILTYVSTDIGGLQIDGFGDGIWLDLDCDNSFINEISFGILQATRTRISKTEYISCPSCGRTLFDLQDTTAKIRKRTHHLKGVKIGIMGCIVNGPGEMADADYGYVGTGPGLISLYKGQQVMEKNIPEHEAVDSLIQLIDSYGDWIEPNNL